jgi:putative ABC transport system permease protein
MIADASLGLAIGESMVFAGEPYRVVGLTKNALTSGGDSVAFVTLSDAQLIALDQPPEATVLERERVVERLRRTDLGRGLPSLEDLARDPRFRAPALASPPLAAVLIEADPLRVGEVRETMRRWGDVSVYAQDEEEALLLGGTVQRARMQIGLFTVILTFTAAIIIMMVIYNSRSKRRTISRSSSSWAPPASASSAWCSSRPGCSAPSPTPWPSPSAASPTPCSPRRVLVTEAISTIAPVVTFVIVTLASMLGVVHVSRIDPARALEG